jgi:hypothetical protein
MSITAAAGKAEEFKVNKARSCFVKMRYVLLAGILLLSVSCGNDKEDIDFIPGFTAENLMRMLEDEFVFHEIENENESDTVYRGRQGSFLNSFNIEITGKVQVKSIDVYVLSMEYTRELKEAASAYFGYLATVPYQNSDPGQARQWVKENFDIHGAKTKIGGVWFSIDRGLTWYMRISAEEPQIEALSEARIREIEEEELALDSGVEESPDEQGSGKILIDIVDIDSNVSKTDIPHQESGSLYFALKVRMVNNSSGDIKLEPRWMLFTNDMHLYGTDEESCYLKKPALEGEIIRGETKEGWLTFKTSSSILFESIRRRFDGDLRPLFLVDDDS